MKIVRYGACDDIDVEFLDDFHYIKTTTYSNFVRGQVKNPYDRDLFGVGYIGVGNEMYDNTNESLADYLIEVIAELSKK